MISLFGGIASHGAFGGGERARCALEALVGRPRTGRIMADWALDFSRSITILDVVARLGECASRGARSAGERAIRTSSARISGRIGRLTLGALLLLRGAVGRDVVTGLSITAARLPIGVRVRATLALLLLERALAFDVPSTLGGLAPLGLLGLSVRAGRALEAHARPRTRRVAAPRARYCSRSGRFGG